MANGLTRQRVPLATDADGVIRVGGTRVTLETVLGSYLDGASPEEIAYRYPALDLADVYVVIAYYLRHREKVDAYLRAAETQELESREENERRSSPAGVRERLLARRATTSSS